MSKLITFHFRVGSLVRSEICIQHRVFNISPHRIFFKIQLKDFLGDYKGTSHKNYLHQHATKPLDEFIIIL